MAERLKAEGFTGAKVLNNDGKIRVSIMSCTTREEGTKQLLSLSHFTLSQTNTKLLTAVFTNKYQRLPFCILSFIKRKIILTLRTTNSFHILKDRGDLYYLTSNQAVL